MIPLLALLLACRDHADVTVISTRDLGPLEQADVIQGRDGGYSVLFGNQSVWAYGDTILSEEGEDGSAWRNNTASWTSDLDASDGVTGFDQAEDALGVPREFLPRTEEEEDYNLAHSGDACEDPCGAREALWPEDMVWDAARGRVLVFYTKIHGEPGEWNFWSMGYGIAEWVDFQTGPVRPEVRPGTDEPTLHWDADGPGWGAAAQVVDDDLYAWACDTDMVSKPCHLARAPLADALDPDTWRYWDGDDWTADMDKVAKLFDGESQLSIHYNPTLDRYLAVYARWTDNRIYLRTAPAPEGPWSKEIAAFDAEPPLSGDFGVYCGMAHGEYMRDNGGIELVSYYRSTTDWHGEVRVVEMEIASR